MMNKSINEDFRDSSKLKGFALYYSILLTLLVSVLVLSFLLYLSYYNKEKSVYKSAIRQMELMEDAFTYILAQPDLFKDGLIENIQIHENQIDSCISEIQPWGLYKTMHVQIRNNGLKFEKVALIGTTPRIPINQALYLCDRKRPLIIAGSTRITGNAVLPKEGVKRGNIRGMTYTGTKLINGETGNSKIDLPTIITTDFIEKWQALPNKIEGRKTYEDIHSFKDDLQVINDLSNIDQKMHGRILINQKNVVINRSADLVSTIVICEKAVIQKGFSGNLQVFARDTIIIEDNVTLNYPSALVIYGAKDNKERTLQIGASCEINGEVIYQKSGGSNSDNKVNILIDERTTIHGKVYCQGNLQLEGTVQGEVMTENFILPTPSTIYQNYLLDATINVFDRSVHYCSSFTNFESEDQLKIIEWLD